MRKSVIAATFIASLGAPGVAAAQAAAPASPHTFTPT